MRVLLTLLLSLLLVGTHAQAQPEGLWLVKEVTVGDKLMTPVARWSRFLPNGILHSGNGWMQHTTGNWKYNPKEASLLLSTENGPKDTAGPFKVTILSANSMQWQRLEEGKLVTVSLEKTEVLPQAPADLIQGLWLLDQTAQQPNNTADQPAYVFMRWDRRFNFRGFPSGLTNGYWHIHGHQPLLTLLADGKEEQWHIDVQPTRMTWTKAGTSAPQEVLHFTRTDTFPE